MEILMWLARFGQASLEEIKEILGLISQIRQAESLAEQVKLVYKILQVAATLSPTSVDDQILALFGTLIDSPLFDTLIGMIETSTGESVGVMSTEQQVSMVKHVEAQGIPFLQLVSIAQLVIQILRQINAAKATTV